MVAFFVQGGIALALIAFGALQKDGFSAMVEFTAPVFWFFFLLTGVALIRVALSRTDNRSAVQGSAVSDFADRVHWHVWLPFLFERYVCAVQAGSQHRALRDARRLGRVGSAAPDPQALTHRRCGQRRRSVLCCAPMQLLQAFKVMTLADWLALAVFFIAWISYAMFAGRRTGASGSLLANTNRYRLLWMMQTTSRENRVVDAVVVQNLSTSPSFFASTTILISRRTAGGARYARRCRTGQGVSVHHGHERVRVRSEADAAARDLRLCVFSFFMVDAPVHVWRAADRVNARGQSL